MDDKNRAIVVKVRLNQAEYDLLAKAAQTKGRSLPSIVRICIHNQADKLSK
jgi:hypothetical protein